MDDDLRARVERLECELYARTTVIEAILSAEVLTKIEKNRPGACEIMLGEIERTLATPRENETEAERDAIRDTYRRMYSRVTKLSPWQADTLSGAFGTTLWWLVGKVRRKRP